MNMFKRWYDADSVVSRAINELEKSSEEIQVRCADYIIDLGPDGGDNGGEVIATGTPEEVAKVKNSYTGQYLKKILK